jgi:hypothetical protein
MSDEPRGAEAFAAPRSIDRADDPATRPAFAWSHGRRFIDVFPVQSGWLVMWGCRNEGGSRAMLGNRIYRDHAGVRRRVTAAVFELTADRSAAEAAVVQFDLARLPNEPHIAQSLPD